MATERASGVNFVYDASKIKDVTIQVIGSKRVRETDLLPFLKKLMLAHGLSIAAVGPPEAEVLLIERLADHAKLK